MAWCVAGGGTRGETVAWGCGGRFARGGTWVDTVAWGCGGRFARGGCGETTEFRVGPFQEFHIVQTCFGRFAACFGTVISTAGTHIGNRSVRLVRVSAEPFLAHRQLMCSNFQYIVFEGGGDLVSTGSIILSVIDVDAIERFLPQPSRGLVEAPLPSEDIVKLDQDGPGRLVGIFARKGIVGGGQGFHVVVVVVAIADAVPDAGEVDHVVEAGIEDHLVVLRVVVQIGNR